MFPGRLVLVMCVVQVAHAHNDQGIQCNNEERCSSHASIDRSLLQVQRSAVKSLVDETKASGATDKKKLASAAVSALNKAQREQAEKRVGGENLKTPAGDQEDGDMEHSQGREDKRDEDNDAENGEEDDGGRDGDIQKMEVEMVDDGELEIETEVEEGKEDRGGKGDEDDEKNDGGHESDAPALLAKDASEIGRRRIRGAVSTNRGICRRRNYCGFNNQARTRTRRRIPLANRRRTVPVGGNVDLRHRRRRTITRRRILMYRGGTRRRHHCLNDNGHRVPCPAGYK